jgi:hypothetical protein
LSNGSARWPTRSQYSEALSIEAPTPAPDNAEDDPEEDEEEGFPELFAPEFELPCP